MEFQCLNTFPQEMEAEWNDLLLESVTHVPFLRHEYLKTWWQTRGGGEWPAEASLAIVTARQNGRLVGVAPLFLADNHQGQPVLLLLGSIEISDYLDLIVRPPDLDGFVSELLAFLQSSVPGWTALDLNNLLDDSPTLAALSQSAAASGWGFEQDILQQAPYIQLPGSWETYLAGIDKKQRHEIRRKMRRLEDSGLEFRLRFADDLARVEADADAFMALMAQDPEKAAFLTPPMRTAMRIITRCALEKGCLQLVFLEIDGENAAAYLNFDYLDRVWIYNSGLDRRFLEYSPGWVLLAYLLQWATEQGRKEFDFMRGNEDYKYRFGAIDRHVVRVVIRRPG
jgi:CelD/BcsL family acetyltransferase involved in cellulose biosynthesis